MRENKFNIGQVVKLRSGGPEMTVEKLHEDKWFEYGCIWFDGENRIIRNSFPAHVLCKPEAIGWKGKYLNEMNEAETLELLAFINQKCSL